MIITKKSVNICANRPIKERLKVFKSYKNLGFSSYCSFVSAVGESYENYILTQ